MEQTFHYFGLRDHGRLQRDMQLVAASFVDTIQVEAAFHQKVENGRLQPDGGDRRTPGWLDRSARVQQSAQVFDSAAPGSVGERTRKARPADLAGTIRIRAGSEEDTDDFDVVVSRGGGIQGTAEGAFGAVGVRARSEQTRYLGDVGVLRRFFQGSAVVRVIAMRNEKHAAAPC
jgi:hypothetical protein